MEKNLIRTCRYLGVVNYILFIFVILALGGSIVAIAILFAIGLALIGVIVLISILPELLFAYTTFSTGKFYMMMSTYITVSSNTKKRVITTIGATKQVEQNSVVSNDEVNEFVYGLSKSKEIIQKKYLDLLLNYHEYLTIDEIESIKDKIEDEKSFTDAIRNLSKFYAKKGDFVRSNDLLKFLNDSEQALIGFSNTHESFIKKSIEEKDSSKISLILRNINPSEYKNVMSSLEEELYSFAQTDINPYDAIDILNAICNYKNSKLLAFKIATKNKLFEDVVYMYRNNYLPEFDEIIYKQFDDIENNFDYFKNVVELIIKYKDTASRYMSFLIDNKKETEVEKIYKNNYMPVFDELIYNVVSPALDKGIIMYVYVDLIKDYKDIKERLHSMNIQFANIISSEEYKTILSMVQNSLPNVNYFEIIEYGKTMNEKQFNKIIIEIAKKYVEQGKKVTAITILSIICDPVTSKKMVEENDFYSI